MNLNLLILGAVVVGLGFLWLVARTLWPNSAQNQPDEFSQFLSGGGARSSTEQRRSSNSGDQTPDVRNMPAAVRALADEGLKLEACKCYMEQTGAGLLEAKRAVEAYMASVGK